MKLLYILVESMSKYCLWYCTVKPQGLAQFNDRIKQKFILVIIFLILPKNPTKLIHFFLFPALLAFIDK